MFRNNLIMPAVKRTYTLAAPLVMLVPTGQVWVIRKMRFAGITDGQWGTMHIDSKRMFSVQASANINPVLPTTIFPDNTYPGRLIDSFNKFIFPIADEGQTVTWSSSDASGTVAFSIMVLSKDSKVDRFSDGGTEGKVRSMVSQSRHAEVILPGATQDFALTTVSNESGEPTFPFGNNVPPQREYELIALCVQLATAVGVNLTLNGARLVHEGRDLITPTGVVVTPANLSDVANASTYFILFDMAYRIKSAEALQVFLRVTSTDGGNQTATVRAALIMNEYFLDRGPAEAGV